jgi:hypothetical protein
MYRTFSVSTKIAQGYRCGATGGFNRATAVKDQVFREFPLILQIRTGRFALRLAQISIASNGAHRLCTSSLLMSVSRSLQAQYTKDAGRIRSRLEMTMVASKPAPREGHVAS